MSATIEQGLFPNYFARPVAGKPECAPVLKVEGRTYEVKPFYLDDLADTGQVRKRLSILFASGCFLCFVLSSYSTVNLCTVMITDIKKVTFLHSGVCL